MSIAHGLARYCWFLLKCSLLAGVLGLMLAFPHLYRRVDEEVRRRIETKLAQHYSGLTVTVRYAALVQGKGIEVRGLSIADPEADEPCAELINVEQAFFSCRTELNELLKGEPEITQVVLRRPVLRFARQADGTWSASRLLPLPSYSRRPPETRIESGTIEIVDPQKDPAARLALRDVNLAMSPADLEESGGRPGMRKFQGTLGGNVIKQIEVAGLVDPSRPEWELHGSVEGLEISPELRDALPCDLSARLAPLGSLRGQAAIQFHAAYDPSATPVLRFEVTGQLTRGRLEDPRLPLPLTDIRAALVCDQDGLAVRNVFARSGRSTLQLAYRRAGYNERAPYQLQAEVRDLELDPQLTGILPEAFQRQWHKYLPSGQINADVKLAFDGRTWQPDITVQCLNVSFAYEKFRYRLEHASGTITLQNNLLKASVTAYSGSQPVRVAAEISDPLTDWHGAIESRAENIPLDDKLLNALPEKAAKVIRSLNPTGALRVQAKVWREGPGGAMHRQVVAGLNRVGIRYQGFPYPITEIRGTLEMLDDAWTFHDLEGTNDSGRFTANGHLVPVPQGHELRLWLTGVDVPLEEELRDALLPNMQQVWNDLRPRGTVDLKADVFYVTGQEKLDVGLRAWPRSETASIEPIYFPYRLEKLRGALTYEGGRVRIEQFKGEHGSARLSTAGSCEFLPDGSWRLALEGLTIDRLRLDRELVQALPQRLKGVVAGLNPEGPVNLHGNLAFARSASNAPLVSDWDLGIDFHQGALDCGPRLENLEGTVRLAGGFDGQRFRCRGDLEIESLTYKDWQFTRLTGPVWIDDDRVLLGTWVDRPAGARPAPPANPAPRPLTAQLFGGTVQADASISLGAEPRFNLEATYADGDLARFAQEVIPGLQDLKGKIAAAVVLRGKGRSLNELGGHGSIRLREADIYEVPIMVALLKILSIRRPNRTAFSTADIDFRIDANHIYFDRLNFNGDAISLVGQGEMNFQSEINLVFHALVGRADRGPPLVDQVLGGASQQLMQIHVGGTLHDPKTSRQAFPGVNRALQQLQAERNQDPQRRLPRKVQR